MSDKKATPMPLGELARGSDLGRRLAKLEDKLGGRAQVHWALTRDGEMHCRQGRVCALCPPREYRQVTLTPNGYMALVTDSRAKGHGQRSEEQQDVMPKGDA